MAISLVIWTCGGASDGERVADIRVRAEAQRLAHRAIGKQSVGHVEALEPDRLPDIPRMPDGWDQGRLLPLSSAAVYRAPEISGARCSGSPIEVGFGAGLGRRASEQAARQSKVGCGVLSIVRTPLRNVGHPHPLRTSAIVMHTRMDGIASSGTERDLRVRSVAPPSSARYLDRRVVEARPFGEIRPEIVPYPYVDAVSEASLRSVLGVHLKRRRLARTNEAAEG
jgi:hypothetical protein